MTGVQTCALPIYIKFALYQIICFIGSIPKVNKFVKNESEYSKEEVFCWLNRHAKKSLDLVNINVKVTGMERVPNGKALFVLNHSSMLDSYILISSAVEPMGVIIADEPVWHSIPIVSKWMKLIKCVFINRANNREGIKSINQAANNILEGQSMAVFPEGDLTWVNDENALISEFKPGAFKIAYKAKCPIIPMVIKNSKGTYEGYQPVGKITSKDVEVEYLNPVYDHLENPKLKTVELANSIREKMLQAMK